jgi:hypothetical protein
MCKYAGEACREVSPYGAGPPSMVGAAFTHSGETTISVASSRSRARDDRGREPACLMIPGWDGIDLGGIPTIRRFYPVLPQDLDPNSPVLPPPAMDEIELAQDRFPPLKHGP